MTSSPDGWAPTFPTPCPDDWVALVSVHAGAQRRSAHALAEQDLRRLRHC